MPIVDICSVITKKMQKLSCFGGFKNTEHEIKLNTAYTHVNTESIHNTHVESAQGSACHRARASPGLFLLLHMGLSHGLGPFEDGDLIN